MTRTLIALALTLAACGSSPGGVTVKEVDCPSAPAGSASTATLTDGFDPQRAVTAVLCNPSVVCAPMDGQPSSVCDGAKVVGWNPGDAPSPCVSYGSVIVTSLGPGFVTETSSGVSVYCQGADLPGWKIGGVDQAKAKASVRAGSVAFHLY